MFRLTIQNLRLGLRRLRQRPGFAAAAILTLALGIGGHAAIFRLVEVVVLQPIPYKDPERLVELRGTAIRADHLARWN